MIETGRHQNIDRNLRFCQICLQRNVYTVEDEFHFFFCVLHTTLSEKFILSQNGKILLQPYKKFHNIMSSNVKSDIFSVAKYLLSSFNHRKQLLHTVN